MSTRSVRGIVLLAVTLAVLGQSSAWGYDVWKSRDFNWWEFEEFADPLPMASEGHTEGPGTNADMAVDPDTGYPIIARAEIVEDRYECGQYITDIKIYVDEFNGTDWDTTLVDTIAGEPVGCPNADAAQEAHLFELQLMLKQGTHQPILAYAFGRYRSSGPDYYYGARTACKTTSGWDLLDLKSITANAQEVYPGNRGQAGISMSYRNDNPYNYDPVIAWVLTRKITGGAGYDSVIGAAQCPVDATNGFGTHSYGWQDQINYNPRRTYIPRAELMNINYGNNVYLLYAYTPTTSDNTTTLYSVKATDPSATPQGILAESGINNCSTLEVSNNGVAYAIQNKRLITTDPYWGGYQVIADIPQTYGENLCSQLMYSGSGTLIACNKGLVKWYLDGEWSYEQVACWETDSSNPTVPTVDLGGTTACGASFVFDDYFQEIHYFVLGNKPTDLNGGSSLSLAVRSSLFDDRWHNEYTSVAWYAHDWHSSGGPVDLYNTTVDIWWESDNGEGNSLYGWDAAAQPGMASYANETVVATLYRVAQPSDVAIATTTVPLSGHGATFDVSDMVPFDAQGNLYTYYIRAEVSHDATFCSGTTDVSIETNHFQLIPQSPTLTITGPGIGGAGQVNETDADQNLTYTVSLSHEYHQPLYADFTVNGTGAHPVTMNTDVVLQGYPVQLTWPILDKSSKNVGVVIKGDNVGEFDEQYRLQAFAAPGTPNMYGDDESVTLYDDDRVLEVRFQQAQTSLFTAGPLTLGVSAEAYCNVSGYPYGAFSVTANLVSDPHSIVDWLSNTTSGTSGVTSCTLNFNAGTGGTAQTKNAYVRLKQMQLGLHTAGIVLQNPTNGVTLGSPSGHVITVCTEE